MAATTQMKINTGSGPTVASAESGIGFGRSDAVTSTTPIPKPTATGTAFSYPKWLHLHVTDNGSADTSISARQVRHDASSPVALPTGMELFFKDGTGTYTQAAANADSDSGSNGADPSGYTAMSTSAQTWSATSVAADTDDARNGNYLVLAIGISNNYAGGAGPSLSLPNIIASYTES